MSTHRRYESPVGRILCDSDDGWDFEQLGAGAYGSTYRVSDKSGKKKYALKVFDQVDDDQAKESRKAETDTLQKLKGADGHVPVCHSIGTYFEKGDGSRISRSMPAFAMDFVTGETLEDVIKHKVLTGGASLLNGKQALEVMEKVCEAVAACHLPTGGEGCVHRDLAPKNIMVDIGEIPETDNRSHAFVNNAVIVDWGQAPRSDLHSTPAAKGTPLYAAPELLRAQPTKKGGRGEALGFELPTVDVWSLGAIAYFVRTGRHPSLPAYSSLSDEEKFLKWAEHKEQHPISLPDDCNNDNYDKYLNEFIRCCTEKDYKKRPKNAGKAREYLDARKHPNQSKTVPTETPSLGVISEVTPVPAPKSSTAGASTTTNKTASSKDKKLVTSSSATASKQSSTSLQSSAQKTASKRKTKKRIVAVLAVVIALVASVAAANGLGLFDMLDAWVSNATSTASIEDVVTPRASVGDYSWEELAVISDEIAGAEDEDAALEVAKRYNLVNEDGTLDGTQTKSVTLTDGTETSVQIVGFAHDNKSDGSGKAGITFMFTDAIASHAMNSENTNYGGWEASEMRSWLAGEGMALLPTDLQDVIVAVDKYTNNTGQIEDASSVTTTSDELWLFSYVELAGEVDGSELSDGYAVVAAICNAEGSQYKLFSDCGVEPHHSSDILIKTYQDDSRDWWVRSPWSYNSHYFMYVDFAGDTDYCCRADYSDTVVPGFCISLSTKESVEDDVALTTSLEDYSWAELAAISDEIAQAEDEDAALEVAKRYNLVNDDGTLDGTQTKSVTLTDGTVTSVQIAGFVHDDKSDGSGKAGITFIFTDAIATNSMNSSNDNTGGWESSDMRSWLSSDGKSLLPEELQDVLVAVDKFTNNVGYVEDGVDVSSVITTTSDELWLFSYVELVGELDESYFSDGREYLAAIYSAEGSQYKLFSDCDVVPYNSNSGNYFNNAILAKTYQDDSYGWWERSPSPSTSNCFIRVTSVGRPYQGILADYSFAVVPGFCISSSTSALA